MCSLKPAARTVNKTAISNVIRNKLNTKENKYNECANITILAATDNYFHIMANI